MTRHERRSLVAAAVPRPREPARWADLGAGDGAFTSALAARLGAGSQVLAIDLDERALARLRHEARGRSGWASIDTVAADFTTEPLPAGLDGILLANALHYVTAARQATLLAALAARLAPAGRVVVVEYDLERGNPWVPHPLPARRFATLAGEAGLERAEVVAEAPSRYWGRAYCGLAFRASAPRERP